MFLLVCILPWDDTELGASPYVAAFNEMGIPYADDIMNAVVLTAVLSCLNSGLYTASRMLFVLAAPREAPMRLITVNSRGVPVWAILASTVIGFLSVIAAYVSPDTVFMFLLNSSGAVILFVYLLIAISQFVLRRQHPRRQAHREDVVLPVADDRRRRRHRGGARADGPQRRHALAAPAQPAVLGRSCSVLYAVTRWRGGSIAPRSSTARRAATGRERASASSCWPTRPSTATPCTRRCTGIDGSDEAEYLVVVPANPVDTGQADREGAAFVWEADRRRPRRSGST